MGNFILGIITGIVLFVLIVYVTCEISEKNRDKDIIYVRMTKSEMEEFENSPDMCSEVVHITVPRKLLFDWWIEQGEHKREFGVGYIPETEDGLITWLREEYTWDETYDLYDWLKAHNYYWKRLD